MKITTYIKTLREAENWLGANDVWESERGWLTSIEQKRHDRLKRQADKFARKIEQIVTDLEHEVEELYDYLETGC